MEINSYFFRVSYSTKELNVRSWPISPNAGFIAGCFAPKTAWFKIQRNHHEWNILQNPDLSKWQSLQAIKKLPENSIWKQKGWKYRLRPFIPFLTIFWTAFSSKVINPFLHILISTQWRKKASGKELGKWWNCWKSHFTFFHIVFYAVCIFKSFNSHISVAVKTLAIS